MNNNTKICSRCTAIIPINYVSGLCDGCVKVEQEKSRRRTEEYYQDFNEAINFDAGIYESIDVYGD